MKTHEDENIKLKGLLNDAQQKIEIEQEAKKQALAEKEEMEEQRKRLSFELIMWKGVFTQEPMTLEQLKLLKRVWDSVVNNNIEKQDHIEEEQSQNNNKQNQLPTEEEMKLQSFLDFIKEWKQQTLQTRVKELEFELQDAQQRLENVEEDWNAVQAILREAGVSLSDLGKLNLKDEQISIMEEEIYLKDYET
ncbi:MAG: hypothetical protein EZS28_054258, partial [Streblomastix strix]